MATAEQLQVLTNYYWAACDAGHIWPGFAACEAVVESAWGTSELARDYHNLFGQKTPMVGGQPTPPAGVLSVSMPTREFIHDAWIDIRAPFLWFTKDADAFSHRMALLNGSPKYAAAIHAADGDDYVREVSKVWATDPNRAESVLEIYYAHRNLLSGVHS